jgi:hypothetical protein
MIEDNINFYEELKKQLNESTNEVVTILSETTKEIDCVDKNEILESVQEDNFLGRCLITNEKLKEGYVTLLCNHSFNYIPLYNDLLHHKKTLYLETQFLKTNEIRCPYCRNKQSILLPYYECMGVPKIIGVNYIKKVGSFIGNCGYDKLKNSIMSNEWYKNSSLSWFDNNDTNIICSNIVTTLKENNKCYCNFHKKKARSLFLKNKKYEEKVQKQEQKQEQKQQQKQQQKQEIQSENIIIDMNLCKVILISGKNKGKQCSQKLYSSEKCKRHYNWVLKNELLKITEETEEDKDYVNLQDNSNNTIKKDSKNLCGIA